MNRISELRKLHGLSQKEFGKKFNAAQNTVCNWELGNRAPDYATLKRMMEFFGVSIDYILGMEDNPPPIIIARPPKPEPAIVKAYNAASEDIRASVRKLLDMN